MEYIQFKRLLQYPELKHAYILKCGDMDFRIGKDFANKGKVCINLQKVSSLVDIDYENIIRPDYNHTNNVEIIHEINDPERPSLEGKNFLNTDGLITSKNNIAIMSTNADCLLLLIYDPVKKVLANVHSGWRGTFGKIAEKTIDKMVKEFNCSPQDIICCLCPSIRKCHFEVDEDVANECKKIFEYTGRLDEIIEKGEVKEGKQKYNIDTVLLNKIMLTDKGIIIENIIDSGVCSVCNSKKIHSRRAEGINFGLGAALIEKNKF